ncbi:BlaI/MecI/CopY family transcriptional regulator [Yimella sp. cx-51]|uniref:BlaI/MecI/CopY family transcriptional regulator n=1 Tax=Yimella sp. cx-51 TaxID=2770551 RepID=UPI00165D4483|nr:BlaI/MecI/CopY family transcriptional regulator [Yimella sp. cx-51]MBC9957897.1 BlaI/MecI/CopY family transcriptional regulator [Yimella sp. cx-51]MBD2759611.1 BlaI/MecI/CopY family transcriptional regulator [Yimella sp. cx-573]QTH38032.1 BlaI/MecI/CopY family transcriptional regulator [Yimella sp. cx-51]
MNRENTSATGLGDLERAIMDVLWTADGPMIVREISERLEATDGKKRAYTTVMTVADRLAKKGLTERERDGRAWRYSAAASREELTAQALRETLADWGGSGESEAVLHFLKDLPAGDVARVKAALDSL